MNKTFLKTTYARSPGMLFKGLLLVITVPSLAEIAPGQPDLRGLRHQISQVFGLFFISFVLRFKLILLLHNRLKLRSLLFVHSFSYESVLCFQIIVQHFFSKYQNKIITFLKYEIIRTHI